MREKQGAGGTTREFCPPRRHGKSGYFFFTLTVCLLLAAAAAATVTVDRNGRGGAGETVAFALSEEGEARLTLFGRDYGADLSFVLTADRFLTRGVSLLRRRLPPSLRLAVTGWPPLLHGAAEGLAEIFGDFA